MSAEDHNYIMLKAIAYAAEKHKFQRRKGFYKVPYINHPIKVAKMLREVGGVTDPDLLIAAVLHDTVEDTQATAEEIENFFGAKVKEIVMEVTDDMSLPKAKRKALQIKRAAHISEEAKKLKIADKACNIHDIIQYPLTWSEDKKLQYIEWAEKVIDQVRGVDGALEAEFDAKVMSAKKALKVYE